MDFSERPGLGVASPGAIAASRVQPAARRRFFDPARVAEAAAATLLARFRDALAQPLRLLA